MATLNLTLTVPDNKAQEILDAYAAKYGYSDASGLTKLQFLKQGVIEHVRQAYLESKVTVATQAAKVAAQQEVNNVPIT